MNALSEQKKELVISTLVEGSSIRSVGHMTGIHRDTIMRLALKVGTKCESLLNTYMKNLSCKRIQMDEIWCYVGKKQKHVNKADNLNEVGDQWVFVAIDADSKLIPSYKIGKRDYMTARSFLNDFRGV